MSPEASPAFIRAFFDPSVYSHPVGEVELIETHISWVLLAGEFAYKIKKPVDFGFLDFSTLDKRHYYCEEELRLNRRWAPSIYLEVLPITGTPQRPFLGGEGLPFEYALKMRRFPQEIRLDHLLNRGELGASHIDLLAKSLAHFHVALPAATVDSPYGSPERVLHPMEENFAQIRPLLRENEDKASLERLRLWSAEEAIRLRGELAERKQQGFIRECHGDLHLGNIVLLDGVPIPFDCIEFNDNLRWIDSVSDLAFTVMDLLDRKRPDFAQRLLNGWLEHTGDYQGLRLLRLYQVYRAMVRAKVAALRAAQAGHDAVSLEAMWTEYRGYISLAEQLSRPGTPLLLITCGLSGSGKTTLTQPLVEQAGAIRLRSDIERKRLFGLQALEKSGSAVNGGIYSTDASQRTYERLLELACQVIGAGYPVIVDATFLRRSQRDAFHDLASRLNVPFAILDFQAREETLRERIRRRQAANNDASEADMAVLEKQLANRESFSASEQPYVIPIDSELADASRGMFSALRRKELFKQ
jgi:aminoglycoside phosphotransferase family enzyme/predicted kinase